MRIGTVQQILFKIKQVAKKIFRIIWKGCLIIVSVVLILLLAVNLLIRIPSVQQKLVAAAADFVSGKTGTTVTVGEIGINFPKSVYLKNVFLDDLKKDTLISAGYLEVNLNVLRLLTGSVHISSVTLEDVTANIYTTHADSLFNFNFIIEAFAGKGQPKEPTAEKKETDFFLGQVELRHIRLNYLDTFHNLLLAGRADSLSLVAEKTDLNKLNFAVSSLALKGADFSVVIPADHNREETSDSGGVLPYITADVIAVSQCNFRFRNVTDSFSLDIENINLDVNKLIADVGENHYQAALASLTGSKTDIGLLKTVKDTLQQSSTEPGNEVHIAVEVAKLRLKDNAFYFADASKQETQWFDAHHMRYDHIQADIDNIIFHGTGDIAADIRQVAVVDQKGFVLRKLEAKALMKEKRMELTGLKLVTALSEINGNVKLSNLGLDSLSYHIGEAVTDITLSRSVVSHADLIYFVPALQDVSYFSLQSNTSVHTEIKGPIKDLDVRQLKVASGNTALTTAFKVKGLPDFRTAYLIMPHAEIISTSTDIKNILPPGTIPDSIFFPDEIKADVVFNGSMENFSSSVNLLTSLGGIDISAELKERKTYSARVALHDFNVGKLLRKTDQIGSVTLHANVNGYGFSAAELSSHVHVTVSEAGYNKYVYHNLVVDVNANKKEYDFIVQINDSNVVADIKGNMVTGQATDHITVHGNIAGIDMKKLNFSENDLRLSSQLEANLLRDTANGYVSGKLTVTNTRVRSNEQSYLADSVLILEINPDGFKDNRQSSAIADIRISGKMNPVELPASVTTLVNNYFFVSAVNEKTVPQRFDFMVMLNNHPLVSEYLMKDLKIFIPDSINGSYDSEHAMLEFKAGVKELSYKDIYVLKGEVTATTGSKGLSIQVTAENLKRDPVNVNGLRFDADLKDQQARLYVETRGGDDSLNTALRATISRFSEAYQIRFGSMQVLNSQTWNVPESNEIRAGNNFFTVSDFSLRNGSQFFAVSKITPHDSLQVSFRNFELMDLSRFINKDSSLVQGQLDGDFAMAAAGGIQANIMLRDLKVAGEAIGTISVNTFARQDGSYQLAASLKGSENDVSISGSVNPANQQESLHLVADITSLNMKSVEALSMGQIRESSGIISGRVTAGGNFKKPEINGDIRFINASTVPAFTNIRIILKDERISISDDKISFPDFTVRDERGHEAMLTGNILKNGFSDFRFALHLRTRDFTLLNTTKSKDKDFFGSVVVNCDLNLTGDMDVPKIVADISVKKGTQFTYMIPEGKNSTDKGEGIIVFIDTAGVNAILTGNAEVPVIRNEIKGIDISTNLRIEPEAVLSIVIDPVSGDSLTVKGSAMLSFSLDKGGKMSLTGRYELTDGSYLVSIQNLFKRRFRIQPGSTIIFNGDPLDADVDIRALYKVTTSPADLVAGQTSGMSEEESKAYRQPMPFEIYLILKEKLLAPNISFVIDMPEDYRDAMGGAVNSKLKLLNEDPSELNKQVFSLLIFNRFIPQDPLASSGGGAEAAVRTSVSKLLTEQINRLSSQYIKGVELNVDVQSYANAGESESSATTEVDVGVKKNFFKDRLSVEVGSSMYVEGSNQQGSSGDLNGNAVVEYKLTRDGRLSVKGFRQNEYAGIIDGMLVETGVGLIYSRDFGKWKYLFKSTDKKE